MSAVNGTPNVPAVPPLQPAKFTCQPCKVIYPLGSETTAYLYTKQPWFNHFVTVCPKCGRDYTVWCTKPQMNHMAHNNVADGDRLIWKIADFCDDQKVIKEFCLDNNKPLPEDRWLSPRALKRIDTLVAWWAYCLEHDEPKAGS